LNSGDAADINDAAEDARRVVRLLAPLKKQLESELDPWNPGELPSRDVLSEAD